MEEWVMSLSRDNVVSLSLFLCFQLENLLGFSSTNAASIMLAKSDLSGSGKLTSLNLVVSPKANKEGICVVVFCGHRRN